MSAVVSENDLAGAIVTGIEKGLDASSPLFGVRKAALENFKSLGLPAAKSEEYKHTPITRLLGKAFSFDRANAPGVGVHLNEFIIPNLGSNVLVFINGKYSREHSTLASGTDGIDIV